MSRIGKQPIPVPAGVTVTLEGSLVRAKGPKGELIWQLPPPVTAALAGSVVTVSVPDPDQRKQRALWGLSRMLVANMLTGVSAGFEKRLEIQGVGYRAEVNGSGLVLMLGYSHPVPFTAPQGITLAVEKNIIVVSGADKQVVGEVAASIRRFRKPEPYKGKGIRYVGEAVRRKAGKVVKAVGAK